jgi:CheY-like chemotaxis protein
MHVLRADVSVAHIPILALSANAMPDDFQKGIAAGFFSYNAKPINIRQFMIALDTALTHSNTTKGPLISPQIDK